MPIKSYLAYPQDRQKEALMTALRALPECQVIPATNHELLVLVTDTADEASERELETRLKELHALQCLALVSGYTDPPPDHT